MSYIYRAFDITIHSELKIVALVPGSGGPHVSIRCGTVPASVRNPAQQGVCYQSNEEQLLLRIASVGSYLVEGGREIVVAPAPGAECESVTAFLLGVALPALLRQRGMLTLRGSVVAGPKGGVLLIGEPGAGKSTAAAVLWRRGFQVVSDGPCVVAMRDGRAMALGGFRTMHVWSDVLEAIGVRATDLRPVRRPLPVYHLCTAADQEHTPVALTSIVAISPHDGALEMKSLDGWGKIRRLSAASLFLGAAAPAPPQVVLQLASLLPQRLVLRTFRRRQIHEVAALIEEKLAA